VRWRRTLLHSRAEVEMPTLRHIALAAALALLVLPAPTRAAGNCKISTGAALAFGTYSPFATTDLDVNGSVSYDCNSPTSPVLSLSRGNSPGFLRRQMTQGANVLEYNVYTDASRTVVFGDGSGVTRVIPGVDAKGQVLPLFGRIFAGQNVPRAPTPTPSS
jgi:spore coat protein U-like protein